MNERTARDPLLAEVWPDIRRVDLSSPASIHIVGVGGAGMSAIATVLITMGHRVSGSDLKESGGLDTLRALGVEVRVGHDAGVIAELSPDVLARSTAIPDHNVEVSAANDAGIPVHSRAEILASITNLRRCIAVAGTHGKTTTSSMLALILRSGGVQPSFIIGGDLNEIGSGAVWDEGDLVVVEADESDGTFLTLDADLSLVTSVDPDHIDFYGSIAIMEQAFREFVENTAQTAVVCIDDPEAAALCDGPNVVTYGVGAEADVRIVDYVGTNTSCRFALEGKNVDRCEIELLAPGIHNARNATGALVMAQHCGVDTAAAVRALGRYTGVARRFEVRGEHDGITFVDDYAHLPAEVELTLAAAQDGEWGRVVCVFQPHRFSRTAALHAEFADSFGRADVLFITDIYPAGEAPRPGVSGELVVDAVRNGTAPGDLRWVATRGELIDQLVGELGPGDLCLTLGAGDLTLVPDEVLGRLVGS